MDIKRNIETARSELKNIRQQLETLKRIHKKEVANINALLSEARKPVCIKCRGETEPDLGAEKVTDTAQHGQTGILWHFKPIGHIQSTFKYKNGTPRQSGLCRTARATLTIHPNVFNNPAHSMEGLEEFSHVWVVFVFHKNSNSYSRAKVKPPRLNGARVGLFSTRSPYRPNPIGLSLCCVERVEGSTLHLSGVDLLDGTPVLDVKPYIPEYDQPFSAAVSGAPLSSTEVGDLDAQCGSSDEKSNALAMHCGKSSVPNETSEMHCETSYGQHEESDVKRSDMQWKTLENRREGSDTLCGAFHSTEFHHGLDIGAPQEVLPFIPVADDKRSVKFSNEKVGCGESPATVASWLQDPPVPNLAVSFTAAAKRQIAEFDMNKCGDYKLGHLKDSNEVAAAIVNILECDPRSSYRRKQCQDRLYYFTVDEVHVTCWFDGDAVEVVKVQPQTRVIKRNKEKQEIATE